MSAETAVELFHADGKPSGVWYCSECYALYNQQEHARSCHGIITHCKSCGKELGQRQRYYRTRCDECSEKQRRDNQAKEELDKYTKATKIKASEYTGSRVYFGGKYYETVEDAIDGCDEPPEYVWAAKNVGLPKATIEDLIYRVLDEAWEDADPNVLYGLEELQEAVDAFNEANSGIAVYVVDYREAIVLDDEILARWRQRSQNER